MTKLRGALKLEDIPRGEAAQIKEIAKITAELQKKRKAALDHQKELLRGVHPKSHGCVNAVFTVRENLRESLRVGLFADPGRRFKAKIRYSNATTFISPDSRPSQTPDGKTVVVNESRGFALKVLGAGRKVLIDDGKQAQDFLMINTPMFAFQDVRAYLRLMRVLNLDPAGVNPLPFFAPLVLTQAQQLGPDMKLVPAVDGLPEEILQMRALYQGHPAFKGFGPADMAATLKTKGLFDFIGAQVTRNPIEASYFTAAPFRFGRERVARFAVVPDFKVKKPKAVTVAELANLSPNYLAEALDASVRNGEGLDLRLQAQVLHPVEVQGNLGAMIEDATEAWDSEKYEWVDMGTIHVSPKGQPKNLVDACKKERFSPWHCLPEHEPLGGINRLRRPVYDTSGDVRLRRKPAVLATPIKTPKIKAAALRARPRVRGKAIARRRRGRASE